MNVQRRLEREPTVLTLVAGVLTLVALAGCGGDDPPKEPTPTPPVALRCEGWQPWLQEIDPEIEAIVDILTHMAKDPAPSKDTYKYWETTLRDLREEVKDSEPPPAFAEYVRAVQSAAQRGEDAANDLKDGHQEWSLSSRHHIEAVIAIQDIVRNQALRDCPATPR